VDCGCAGGDVERKKAHTNMKPQRFMQTPKARMTDEFSWVGGQGKGREEGMVSKKAVASGQ
jgi:hypothetical protein